MRSRAHRGGSDRLPGGSDDDEHDGQGVTPERLFFSTFAVNQYPQYRGVGPWRDYAFGEKTYLVLSLIAKSLLAWQIFGSSLAV